MNQSKAITEAMLSGDPVRLDAFREEIQQAPELLMDAIDRAPLGTIEWMLAAGLSPSWFSPEDGPLPDDGLPLHAAIYREKDDRHRVVEMLLDAGADIHERGMWDYTPAHLAAVKNQVEVLKVLHARGAEFSLRTRVDDYATPLEEVKEMRPESAEVIAYLEGIGEGTRG